MGLGALLGLVGEGMREVIRVGFWGGIDARRWWRVDGVVRWKVMVLKRKDVVSE